jgi:hypothetical protein
MKAVITIYFILFAIACLGQGENAVKIKTRLNIYVISKSEKFELFPFTVKLRAFAKSIFSRKRMRVIVASKSEYAAAKVETLMKKHHAFIGSLWFDSHGLYKNGFSSFSIGADNFNYKNIGDTAHTAFLKRIALFADAQTKVGIGSCYGGASFTHPGSSTVKSGPMHGDSLMKGMGNIFMGSTIYASGGWVMMKPGIFSDNFGFAGYPLGKKYKTLYWKPVWDHLGEWYSYSSADGCIKNINTVALTRIGEITVRARNYLSLAKAIKKQDKTLAALQPQ